VELLVFDLDGTLLDRNSRISGYTAETLKLLSRRGIAYTVATGRTLHGARAILEGHRFELPQAYKNGVMIWHPEQERLSYSAMLTRDEVANVIMACDVHGVTPFLFTVDENNSTTVYHPPVRSHAERKLLENIDYGTELNVRSLDSLPPHDSITHINAIGEEPAIRGILDNVNDEPHLVAYSGVAMEGSEWRWIDIHHSEASKGGAIATLKDLLNLERVICFGDSYNDLSMFEAADESYAPDNATSAVKAAATEVIGHHDDEGIARFLRQRFSLDPD
jgi:Cof subfamily protein (haloacid dehalogenase superfamily)